jgi:dTDP-4-dehydrorhamnose 3,5-epimerase
MHIEQLPVANAVLVTPKRHGDHRGFFSEVFNAAGFADAGITDLFVQDNHSFSAEVGVLRGLHFQTHPFAQGKLVRCARGAVLDVIVDLRRGSPTFGRHASAILSAENWTQLWAPPGVAHGFCTLEPNSEVLYKVTAPYAADHDKGLNPFDPALAIAWPVAPEQAVMKPQDRNHPNFDALPAYFEYAQTP